MRFYILDDMVASVKVLENIIEAKDLGEIVGTGNDPDEAIPDILAKVPDIVLVDLLMPKKDGITVVKEIRAVNQNISFIMISQVVEKQMIEEAYSAGIEFFITKPNNRIEIENVIRNVIEKRRMAQVLSGIRNAIGGGEVFAQPARTREDATETKARKILGSLGMLGESGTKDILAIQLSLSRSGSYYDGKTTLDTYALQLDTDPKIIRQRIRRAIRKGLSNLASLGVEDAYNDVFSDYAHTLFDFETVRSEMNLIRGKGQAGGSPSIDKFMEGLQLLCKDT